MQGQQCSEVLRERVCKCVTSRLYVVMLRFGTTAETGTEDFILVTIIWISIGIDFL